MDNTIKYSFLTYFSLTLIGAIMKLNHLPYNDIIMSIGIISLGFFIIQALVEINKSRKIDKAEKFMWSIGMIFMSFFAGIVYVFSARKRIV